MYFKDFPSFYYDFKQNDGTTKTSIVKDITRNIRFRRDILANVSLYDQYDIQDGDTPEIIAEKVYGNAQYHWVVMLLNEKFDYISDFPLDEVSLVKYIESKYGVAGKYAIHHYENADGYVVDSDAVGATSVDNDTYERRVNETKRTIKLVAPSVLNNILKNYKDLL